MLRKKLCWPEWSAIVALLLLAFALRTFDLTRVPPGLHNDEVADAEITETVVGGRLAIFFPENIGNEGLYYYFAAPFMQVLGTTVFALRLPAAFLSMMGMGAVWALARRLFGPIVALAALAGFAIAFWTLAFGRIVLHVIMEVPVAALAAYFFWRGSAARGQRALGRWALSGMWLGLSIHAYTAARILPAIFIAFGLYILMAHRPQWRRWWQGIAIVLMVAALVALPLLVYLVRNPFADQLGFFDIDRPLTELRRGNLAPALETSLRTLGMFAFVGDPLPYYDVPGRPVLEPVGAGLLAVGLLIAVGRWRRPEYAFVVLWFFLALLPGMLSQPAPNYTRTIGVQVVLFALPGIAIAALLNRWRSALVYLGLAILFAGNLAWTVRDYFTVWPALGIVRFWHQSGLKAVADYLQTDPDTSPVVVCVPDHLLDERAPWWIPAWRHMRYLLHRPDLALRYCNCADTMILIDGPARYAFPDVADESVLAQSPVYTGFLATARPDLAILPDRLGIIVVADQEAAQEHLSHLPVNFQDRVELVGYTLSASALKPGDSFELATYWRVTGDLPSQLTQFTHVLNDSGAIVAQQDRLALTSASLRPGDMLMQVHHLTLPGGLADGNYALSIGLYTPSTGARLIVEQAGQARGDRLYLKSLQVER